MPMNINPWVVMFYAVCFGGTILHYVRTQVRPRAWFDRNRGTITGTLAALVLGGSAAAFMVAGLAETRWPVPVAAPTGSFGRPLDMLGYAPQVVGVTVGAVEWIGDRHCRVPVGMTTLPVLVAAIPD